MEIILKSSSCVLSSDDEINIISLQTQHPKAFVEKTPPSANLPAVISGQFDGLFPMKISASCPDLWLQNKLQLKALHCCSSLLHRKPGSRLGPNINRHLKGPEQHRSDFIELLTLTYDQLIHYIFN